MSRKTILGIGLALAGLVLFMVAGFSDGDSALYNYPWTVRYLEAFDQGARLPRHLPGLWAGLGGYDFFFYAPLPFWPMAAIVDPICLGCAPDSVLVLGVAVFWVLGGVSFFLFCRRYLDIRSAGLAAVIYSVLPYHLWVDWFIRQAAGEVAAYAFIPLAAFGFDAIRLNARHKWTLALGTAGVALCHLPTALLAGHVFAVLVAIVTVQKLRQGDAAGRFLGEIVGWTGIGGGLAAFYWLPALTLLDTVSPGALYSDHFVARNWLFGPGAQPPYQITADLIWYSFLIVLPSLAVAAFIAKGALRLWIIAPVVVAVFLNTQLSGAIWDTWIIQKVQFPWRLMVFVDFSAAIAIALIGTHLKPTHRLRVLSALLVLAFFPAMQVGSRAIVWATAEYDVRDNHAGAIEYFSPEMFAAIKARIGAEDLDSFDHVAIRAESLNIRRDVNASADRVADYHALPRQISFVPAHEVGTITIPVQYWFLWQGTLADGTALTLSANPRTGTIDVAAPPQGFQGRTVTLVLPYHSSEKFGVAVSAISVLLALLLVWFGRRTDDAPSRP